MIVYPSDIDFEVIFELVEDFSGGFGSEPCPYYSQEEGLKNYQAVFELAENDDYYPFLLDKATYIFVSVVKGHFFSNGNKRLGVMSLAYFMMLNGLKLSDEAKISMLSSLQLSQIEPKTIHYFFYILAKYVASSEKNFDELKTETKEILGMSFVPKNQQS